MRNRTLSLIRHAPIEPSGRLFGQTDADITLPTQADIAFLAPQIQKASALYSSPAQRCLKSCAAILPDRSEPIQITAFWEQHFGDWEGMSYADIPDIGDVAGEDLVQFKAPNGESFADVCQRVRPALDKIIATDSADHIAIFAHAGVIRAILSMAFESQIAALKCEINTLSNTKLRILPDGHLTVVSVNSKPTIS